MALTLQIPALDHLPFYRAALEAGWSSDNTRSATTAEELQRIADDADGFLAGLDDPEGRGPPVILVDGSSVPRLPCFRRFLWDGEFCGSINFRWKPGTAELPPTCLGHIGFAVVPWKQGRGCATEALRLLLPEVRLHGLPYAEFTTTPDNIASQKVIVANGGVLVERFVKPAAMGGGESLRFRIAL